MNLTIAMLKRYFQQSTNIIIVIGSIAGEYEMITLVNGKSFLMYKGHTYCFQCETKAGQRMRCTKTSICKAFLVLSHDGVIMKLRGEHTHNQQNYQRLANGKYMKLYESKIN